MELKIINSQGELEGNMAVNEAVFGKKYNEALVHQVVNAFLANARMGNRKQKTRAEIAKSTKKPWRQKGTGRARAGAASSPIWRGGGRTFPNSPLENFTQKVNRKMYKAAMVSIISKLVSDERLIVTNEINVATTKTKDFVNTLKGIGLSDQTLLIVIDEFSDMDESNDNLINLYYASRNLRNVLVIGAHQLDPYELLRADKVLFMKKAIAKVEGLFTC